MGMALRLTSVIVAVLLIRMPAAGAHDLPAFPLAAIATRTVPHIIDIARDACRTAAKQYDIAPIAIADLPESVRDDIEAVFPMQVIEEARIYFGLPLNEPNMRIGFLNSLGKFASKGGHVLGMTFGNDVYMFCPKEAFDETPAAGSVLIHELLHVAQYQALGYDEYKRLYAEEFAKGGQYESVGLELDAYRLQRIYPNAVPPGFFAFYPFEFDDLCAAVSPVDATATAPVTELQNVESKKVVISESHETLPRRSVLLLSAETIDGKTPIPAQLLDPLGGPPLYVFKQPLVAKAAVRYNKPVTKNGPTIVAVGTDAGVHVLWRDLQGVHTQWIPGKTRFKDTDSDGTIELIQETDTGERTWWWAQKGFTHLWRDLHAEHRAEPVPTP